MRSRRMQNLGSRFGGNPYDTSSEDINPSSYLANLSDCMLVLACGLMVALVVAGAAKLPATTEVEQASEMQEIDNVEDITGDDDGSGSGYTELGKVYQDPDTGKMYMIRQADGDGSESDDSESDESASGLSTSQTGTSESPYYPSSSGSD